MKDRPAARRVANEALKDFDRLERALGHGFSQTNLLRTALTHRSYGTPHNERLEFLGDALLNCVIADLLYARYPALSEGDLSRLRANLVNQDSLYTIALRLELGGRLQLGDGEKKSGGHARPSILADATEALFGAVYLDAGFARVREVIATLYAPLIDAIDLSRAIKDAKTRLQEYLQARKQPLPVYAVVATAGEAHAQEFEVICELASGIRGKGHGSSRRIAEQQAAEAILVAIEEGNSA